MEITRFKETATSTMSQSANLVLVAIKLDQLIKELNTHLEKIEQRLVKLENK